MITLDIVPAASISRCCARSGRPARRWRSTPRPARRSPPRPRRSLRVVDEGRVAYGINTGFGALARTRIDPARLAELQRALVRSHAAGTGRCWTTRSCG
jgi:histidine ammonia-lyase